MTNGRRYVLIEKKPVTGVKGGIAMFGFLRKLKRKKERPIRCVYAGPEMMNGAADPNGSEFNDVYAGPDVFANEPEPDEEEKKVFGRVYAGPPVEPKNDGPVAPPDPQTFMCVYAGPEIMSGTYEPIGAYMPPEEENGDREPEKEEENEPEKEGGPEE